MKTRLPSFLSIPRIAMAALLGVIALPAAADAKPKDKGRSDKGRTESATIRTDSGRNYTVRTDSGRSYSGRTYTRSGDRDGSRHRYHSIPRTSFSLNFGTGYAGSGYYYGPPGVPYYYERPDVRYYRSRSLVPRSYYGESYSRGGTAAAVQRELYRRGYYYGPIDGDIGPGSRRAIARYQSAHRLPVTGLIDRSLLYSLGLA